MLCKSAAFSRCTKSQHDNVITDHELCLPVDKLREAMQSFIVADKCISLKCNSLLGGSSLHAQHDQQWSPVQGAEKRLIVTVM